MIPVVKLCKLIEQYYLTRAIGFGWAYLNQAHTALTRRINSKKKNIRKNPM